MAMDAKKAMVAEILASDQNGARLLGRNSVCVGAIPSASIAEAGIAFMKLGGTVDDTELVKGLVFDKKDNAVLVRGSNRLVPDEAERSLHDALCVIRCLVTKKFLILWWWCAGNRAAEADLVWAKVLHGMESYCVRSFAEALEVIPYTLC
ncbi:hypothetical protein IFM89_003530 [Coptis chinensis]|uniref:Uncharacterized protein n=1 Tax=Coptis chinensis TaxID=261450 RepID=A0A835LCJ6_9MAGN|nr:hypothetical protein IFM89_003530 [Coptis chinensis]